MPGRWQTGRAMSSTHFRWRRRLFSLWSGHRRVGDPLPTRHDILIGSQPGGRAFTDATDHTCNNWTSNGAGSAQVGHSDRVGNGNQSWNSSHSTTGCSQRDLVSWGGVGLFYCFAVN